MRIIGGIHKGRKIDVSRSFDSRPTTDFAKESLFNILANNFNFEEINVLDLFCGTGSISFEFASRGCNETDMVDINGKSNRFIDKVASELGMKGIRAVRMEVFQFISICKKQYNVIFADPPYDLKNIQEIPDAIFNYKLLKSGGWFILEHGKSNNFQNHKHFFKERNYGSVHFSFFKDSKFEE